MANGRTVRAFLVGAVAAAVLSAAPASARVTQIVIARTESPTFEGRSFGSAGPYEKLVGRATGEVDPKDPRNAIITDVALAPRNGRGMVEYSTDLYILRPIDPARGNHRVFFEVNNRGDIRSLAALNDASSSNDPTTADEAGNGFLMRQGYTIVLCGWDVTAAAGRGRLTMTGPVATNPDGSSIVGSALEEVVIDNATTMTARLTYPAATLDRTQASLTVRATYPDAPTPMAADAWEYVDGRTIRLRPAGTPFENGSLYELTYQAKDPLVAGLGFAAVRDVAAFLRHAKTDETGTPNPAAGGVRAMYTFSVSQPTRFVRDFLALGFNEDEAGRQVFDGMLNWIGGASGGFFNYRFAQPGRTHRQHIGRWFPEFQFPFADAITFDPVTGRTDGRLRRCLATRTCPKVFEVNSENEYWAKAMSLLHTDTLGRDLPDAPNVRNYLLANLPHASAEGRGMCQQPRNPTRPNATLRALLVALDAWASEDQTPPPSRVPRAADGTLVPPSPQSGEGFPSIPGVTYNGRLHTGDLFDYGPSIDHGLVTVVPPRLVGSPYPVLVPKTDEDGHDLAGIRQVEVAVPLATYTGWALRAGRAAGDGCDAFGQRVAFAKTKTERMAAGDSRRSLEERYASSDEYVRQVIGAAAKLKAERLLLDEDVERYVAAARGIVLP